MDELISRQVLLDKFEKWQKTEDYSNDEWNLLVDVLSVIKSMPPAPQLSTNLAEVGTDCISRQQAIDDIWTVSPLARLDRKWVDRWLRQLPPAQPEIIRCKDCKYWIPYDWMFREVWQSKNIADYPEDEIGCNLSDMSMKANDFCSRGERREDG